MDPGEKKKKKSITKYLLIVHYSGWIPGFTDGKNPATPRGRDFFPVFPFVAVLLQIGLVQKQIWTPFSEVL